LVRASLHRVDDRCGYRIRVGLLPRFSS
jgi:hypothetical protein